jgi:hypothetical protein
VQQTGRSKFHQLIGQGQYLHTMAEDCATTAKPPSLEVETMRDRISALSELWTYTMRWDTRSAAVIDPPFVQRDRSNSAPPT